LARVTRVGVPARGPAYGIDEAAVADETPAAYAVAGLTAPPAWAWASLAALISALSEGTTAPLARVTRVSVPARVPEYAMEATPAAYEAPEAGSIAPPASAWASLAALTSSLSDGTTSPFARVTRLGA